MRRWIAVITLGLLLFLLSCETRVEELGVFGESRRAEVLGQDGVTPVPFDGRTVMWTFGDTILGTWKGNVSADATFSERAVIRDMISNSLAFTERPSTSNVKGLRFTFLKEKGRVCPFIRHRPGEDPGRWRFWAVDGVRLGDRVYVYYMLIKIVEPGKAFGFRLTGIGLARWDVPAGWAVGMGVNFRRLPDLFVKPPAAAGTREPFSGGDIPAFGDCVIEKDGYVYTMGHFQGKDFASPVKIARVRPGDIERGAAYEFLAPGGAWTRSLEDAEAFLGDVMGECSLSYDEGLRKYIVLYCQTGTGRIIGVMFGDFAELSHVRKTVLYEPPKLYQVNPAAPAWYYSGKEIFREGRSLYAIYINPLEYQPYLLRIEMR